MNPSNENIHSQGGVWVSLAELARIKSVSRQAISKKVGKLEACGRVQTRMNGTNREVELASFDRAVGQVGDASREIGAETRRSMVGPSTTEPSQPPANAALRDAQTDRARYDAQLRALDLAERTGLLVPTKGEHGIETALVRATEAILRDLNGPLSWVSEMMTAAREGEPALRRLLRSKIREQREKIATSLLVVAGAAGDAEASGIMIDLDLEDGA